MPTPSIQTLRADAQQVLNLDSISAVRSVVAATLANANAGTPLNPNLTTQQLWNEFYQIVTQPKSDIESIIANQLMKFLYAPPAPGGAGADKQVIFNDGGVLAGDPQFLWNKTTNLLTVTGSATITGDLTVRTNKLAVTSTGVGCGTATPANQLSVRNEGASGVSVIDVRGGTGGAGALQISGNGTTLGTTSFDFIQNGAGAFILNRDATPLAFSVNGSERYNIGTTGISTWSVAGSTAMTLNSTGLGVGGIVTGTGPTILVEGTAGTYAKFNSKVGAKTWSAGYRSGTTQFEIQEDGTERFVIANGGNVGIGVTPSAWATAGGYRALQVGGVGIYGRNTASNELVLSSNCYFDTTDSRWEYITTAAATRYDQQYGVHQWFSAPSGTANNPISFGDAKMTLDASGNLLVGTTGTVVSSDSRFRVSATAVPAVDAKTTAATQAVVDEWNSDTSGDNLFNRFWTESSPSPFVDQSVTIEPVDSLHITRHPTIAQRTLLDLFLTAARSLIR